jgi:iron-sulfur cluster repair protein YtfE (RIC family)
MPVHLSSFLESQHHAALQLIDALVAKPERTVKTRTELLEKLEGELYHHMLLEEEIVYPALETRAERQHDLWLAHLARAEHDAIKATLKVLAATDPAAQGFEGKLKTVKALVEQHIAHEETSVFPLIQQIFSPAEVNLLGRRVLDRHEELEARRAWSETALVTAFAAPSPE